MLRLSKSTVTLVLFIFCGIILIGCPPSPPRYIEEGKSSKEDSAPLPPMPVVPAGTGMGALDPAAGAAAAAAPAGDQKFETPWAKAKVGRWAMYNTGGESAIYIEIMKVEPDKVVVDEYDGTWHEGTDYRLEAESKRYKDLTFDKENKKDVDASITEIKDDGSENGLRVVCEEYSRIGIGMKKRSQYCDAIPFYNGTVYSESIQQNKVYVERLLVFKGNKPLEREGDKFKELFDRAKNMGVAADESSSDDEPSKGEDDGWDDLDDEGDVPDDR
ncbi:MAG: hypothetical protein ACYS8W_06640 [Planctomycetota bacterium]